MPDPYATPSQVRTFYAGEDTESALYGPAMRNAARLVQRFAPVPDPEPADYAEMAADAELEVGRYLFNSQGGSISSLGAEGMSLSLTNLTAVKSIIAQAMGGYSTVGAVRVRHLQRG
jgi:hypothetical protein